MTIAPRIRQLAALLGVATIGTGAVYAAGTQADGSAVAASSTKSAQTREGPGRGPDVAALAAKLGVSQGTLRRALDATRPTRRTGDRGPAGLVADLATALGVSTASVERVLGPPPAGGRPQGPPPQGARPPQGAPPRGARPDATALAKRLAAGLGLDQATVKAALVKLEKAHAADRAAHEQAMAAALAKKLGLAQDTVASALAATRPDRR